MEWCRKTVKSQNQPGNVSIDVVGTLDITSSSVVIGILIEKTTDGDIEKVLVESFDRKRCHGYNPSPEQIKKYSGYGTMLDDICCQIQAANFDSIGHEPN